MRTDCRRLAKWRTAFALSHRWFAVAGQSRRFSTVHLADGTELMCDYTVTYKDFDNDTDYTEYVFPMAYEDVAGCTLTGDIYTASDLMDGSWAVSFRLTQ